MEFITVNLFDKSFAHSLRVLGHDACTCIKPTKVKWVRNLMEFDGITVFTDSYIDKISLIDRVKSKLKVAWLIEPKAILPRIYKDIKKTEYKFDYIFTHCKELLNRDKKYLKCLHGSSQVEKEKWGIYKKEKLVSLICSKKKTTIGQKLRHKIKPKLGKKHHIDYWGRAYKEFKHHCIPLKDYYFSIAIENSKVDNYFTEKIIEPFLLGTIPIYWGAPNIDEYFNMDGIIPFNSLEQLDNILSNVISPSYYYKHIEAVRDNFERAKKMSCTDDMLATLLMKLWY